MAKKTSSSAGKKARFKAQAYESTRYIVTEFAWGREILKTNRALDPAMAVARALLHMQSNKYQARGCYIYDERTNSPIAAIWRSVVRGITIKYYDEEICVPLIKVDGDVAADDKEGMPALPDGLKFLKPSKQVTPESAFVH